MIENLDKSFVDFGEPAMKMFLDVFKVGHSSWIFFESRTILFQECLAGLFRDSNMPQPLGVIGWNNTNPSYIIKFDIRDDILIFLIFAFP